MSQRRASVGYASYDEEFNAAFTYLLGVREWSAQEFCDRTRLAPDGLRRIHPSSVSDWKLKRKRPSNLAVVVVSEIFGLRRSEFYRLGEDLVRERWELEKREQQRRIVEAQDFEAMRDAVDTMSHRGAVEDLRELEELSRKRRAEAEARAFGE